MKRLLTRLRDHARRDVADWPHDWDVPADLWLSDIRTTPATEPRIHAKTGALVRPPYAQNGASGDR